MKIEPAHGGSAAPPGAWNGPRTVSPAVELVPFAPDHFSSLVEWAETAEALFRWAGPAFRFPLDEGQLDRHLSESPSAQRLPFTVLESRDRRLVGHIELAEVDRSQRSAYVVRAVVAPGDRRRGVASAMLRALMQYAFEELALHRVEMRVFESNVAALRTWERAGMIREGVMRDARLLGGRFHDLVVMSMLEHEWRAGLHHG